MARARSPQPDRTIGHACGHITPWRADGPGVRELCDDCVEAHRIACAATNPPWFGKLRRPRVRR